MRKVPAPYDWLWHGVVEATLPDVDRSYSGVFLGFEICHYVVPAWWRRERSADTADGQKRLIDRCCQTDHAD